MSVLLQAVQAPLLTIRCFDTNLEFHCLIFAHFPKIGDIFLTDGKHIKHDKS